MVSEDFTTELAFLASRHRTGTGLQPCGQGQYHERVTAPLVTLSALRAAGRTVFPQRGLLGATDEDEAIYFNTNTPCSGVVCGVQGSGKSHTVSCILEDALIVDNRIGNLPQPLAGLVFHFDEEEGDRACEAAYLGTPATGFDASSHVSKVTILVSASNFKNRRRAYASLQNVSVQPLLLAEADITAHRLLSLMGWQPDSDKLPLYLHSVMHIVRSMGAEGFSYTTFKEVVSQQKFDAKQKMMLNHRLKLLDGFLKPDARAVSSYFATGEVVLVDLTDPFLDGIMASILFDIILSSFVGWKCTSGKIVVLDEAHKYLDSHDSARLTKSIGTIIRQQRHLATRVIIATQEPTVIPPTILDLSSFIICHRFSSPSWCTHLSRHVGADDADWFDDVMRLPTGDAVVFAPTALINDEIVPLGRASLRVSVRPRLTSDGGSSVMAMASMDEALNEVTTADSLLSPIISTPERDHQNPSPTETTASPTSTDGGSREQSPRPVSTTAQDIKFRAFSFRSSYDLPERFQSLVTALKRKKDQGDSRPLWSQVAADMYDWRELRRPGWFKQLVQEAEAEGIVDLHNEWTPARERVSLINLYDD